MSSQYRIAIYSSPTRFPFVFFCHTFLVISQDDNIDRYEVLSNDNPVDLPSNYDGRIFKNFLPPYVGLKIFKTKSEETKIRYRTTFVSEISGDESSIAAEMYHKIKDGILHTYPHKNNYRMARGPNCNTFTQWVADMDSSGTLTLPWNAWGRTTKDN